MTVAMSRESDSTQGFKWSMRNRHESTRITRDVRKAHGDTWHKTRKGKLGVPKEWLETGNQVSKGKWRKESKCGEERGVE